MTTNIFRAGHGFLYTFDPRAKLLASVLLCIWFFLPVKLIGLYGTVVLIILLGAGNTGIKFIRAVFLSILPMLVFMVLFMPFNARNGQSLVTIGPLTLITKEGALQAARLAGRFIGISYVCALLFATTVTTEFMLALSWYGVPYKATLVVTLAFTYIPFLSDTLSQIAESHKLREADKEASRGLVGRLKDLLPTLTSALVAALRTIPNLAMSLELRGFGRPNPRTRYQSLAHYPHLFTHLILSCIIPLILWLICKV